MKKQQEQIINNNFKSPLNTLKLLLRTQAIPYLIVFYSKDSICTIMNRFNTFILCCATAGIDNVTHLTATKIEGDTLDSCIIDSTKLQIDYSIISEDTLKTLLSDTLTILIRKISLVVKVSDNKFKKDDFDIISRLANLSKYNIENWEF